VIGLHVNNLHTNQNPNAIESYFFIVIEFESQVSQTVINIWARSRQIIIVYIKTIIATTATVIETNHVNINANVKNTVAEDSKLHWYWDKYCYDYRVYYYYYHYHYYYYYYYY
jgi:hypothetical protein